jgi:peptidoglycan hydrolase-like protein with peptidoglycan-binding domain
MIRPILGAIAAVAVAASLGGCSSGAQPAPAPTPVAAPQPPPPPPPPAPAPMTHAQQVQAIQTALNNNGAHLTVDGQMGRSTERALRNFQRQHHLRPTGRPDGETLSALGIQGGTQPSSGGPMPSGSQTPSGTTTP